MSKTSRMITYGVVLLGAIIGGYLLSIAPTKPHGSVRPRTNIVDTITNQPHFQPTNNSSLNTNFPANISTNRHAVFAKDNPKYTKHYDRLKSDTNTFSIMQNFISDLSKIGPKGRLPPWVNPILDINKLRMIKYSDYDDNLGFFVYSMSEQVHNMRVDNINGLTKVKVYEVRGDPQGNPINIASIENTSLRNNMERVNLQNDPFESVAREILTYEGYNLETLASWKSDDWCKNIISGTNIVATRSFGGQGGAPMSAPDLTVTLAAPVSSINNSNSVYSNAFCTSYFVVSDFDKNGNLNKPEIVENIGDSKLVYRVSTKHFGKLSTSYPTNVIGSKQ